MFKRIKSYFVWKRAFVIKKLMRECQCVGKRYVLLLNGEFIHVKSYRAYDPLIFGKSCGVLNNNKCKELI